MRNRTLLAFALLALLGACHTTAGLGEDISRTGKAIERRRGAGPRPDATGRERRRSCPADRDQLLQHEVAQHLRLEGQAVAGALGGDDVAGLVGRRVDPDIVQQAHVLRPEPVRDAGEQMHVELGEQVRRHGHAPGIGDRGDLAQFGQPAAHRVGLQDRQPRVLQHGLRSARPKCVSPPTTRVVKRFRAAEIAGEIVRQHRLLDPVGVVFLEGAAGDDRLVGGPAHVDVDHDLDIRADRVAHHPQVAAHPAASRRYAPPAS